MSKEGKDVGAYLPYLMPLFVKPNSTLRLLANAVFLQCYALTHPEAFMVVNKLQKAPLSVDPVIGHNTRQSGEQVHGNQHTLYYSQRGGEDHGAERDQAGQLLHKSVCEAGGVGEHIQGIVVNNRKDMHGAEQGRDRLGGDPQ